MNPTITIIIATYNRASFILNMLKTIRAQTFKSWECIIVDDGGTDNTEEVISNILKEDNRFKYLKRPNNYKKGLCGSRNYGLDIAKGDYIVFFDDDDLVNPKALEIAYKGIIDNDVDFCHYQKQSFLNDIPEFKNTKTKIIGSIRTDNIDTVITGKIGLASCTVLWKKECFKNIRFNEDLYYAEEWECYIKIISNGFKGVIINNVLYYNRKHQNSNTGEFWSNNPKRVNSKKEAIYLVLKNIKKKALLTDNIENYLINQSLHFRDFNFFKKMLDASNLEERQFFFEKIKYYLFPLWLIKQKAIKKMKINSK